MPYTFYTADETAANAFSAQVAAIGSDPSANADAVAAAKEAYSALTTGAAALAEDAVEALVSLDAARFVYLVGQIGTPVTLESSTAIVAAQAYYATLLDNTADGVAAAKTTRRWMRLLRQSVRSSANWSMRSALPKVSAARRSTPPKRRIRRL